MRKYKFMTHSAYQIHDAQCIRRQQEMHDVVSLGVKTTLSLSTRLNSFYLMTLNFIPLAYIVIKLCVRPEECQQCYKSIISKYFITFTRLQASSCFVTFHQLIQVTIMYSQLKGDQILYIACTISVSWSAWTFQAV